MHCYSRGEIWTTKSESMMSRQLEYKYESKVNVTIQVLIIERIRPFSKAFPSTLHSIFIILPVWKFHSRNESVVPAVRARLRVPCNIYPRMKNIAAYVTRWTLDEMLSKLSMKDGEVIKRNNCFDRNTTTAFSPINIPYSFAFRSV